MTQKPEGRINAGGAVAGWRCAQMERGNGRKGKASWA